MTQYHKALECEKEAKYGEVEARLCLAESAAKEAKKLTKEIASQPPTLTLGANGVVGGTKASSKEVAAAFLSLLVEQTDALLLSMSEKYASAKRDNDIVYHAAIPTVSLLPVVERLSMVKATRLADLFPTIQSVVGDDLFKGLVPMSVHEHASLYSEEQAKLVRAQTDRVLDADAELTASLSSMNFPECLRMLGESLGAMNGTKVMATPKQWTSMAAKVHSIESVSTKDLMDGLDVVKGNVMALLAQVDVVLQEEGDEFNSNQVGFLI